MNFAVKFIFLVVKIPNILPYSLEKKNLPFHLIKLSYSIYSKLKQKKNNSHLLLIFDSIFSHLFSSFLYFLFVIIMKKNTHTKMYTPTHSTALQRINSNDKTKKKKTNANANANSNLHPSIFTSTEPIKLFAIIYYPIEPKSTNGRNQSKQTKKKKKCQTKIHPSNKIQLRYNNCC